LFFGKTFTVIFKFDIQKYKVELGSSIEILLLVLKGFNKIWDWEPKHISRNISKTVIHIEKTKKITF